MKYLLIIMSILGSLVTSGQDKHPVRKILIGFSFSPDYNYRTISNNNGDASIDFMAKSRNNSEVAKLGFTTGLNISFDLSQHMALETGIQFSNKGYNIKETDLVYTTPDPSLPTKAKFNYEYQYICIPSMAKFSLGTGKTRFVPGVGFMTSLLVKGKETIHYEFPDGRKEKNTQVYKSGFRKLDVSFMVSAGIDYSFSNKIHLIIQPTFRYGMLNTREGPVSEHLWNAGLNIGWYYAL